MRNDARKFAIYLCQRHGDIPLNKIADKFELTHSGSATRMIHDAKTMIAEGMFVSQIKKIENQLLVKPVE